MLVSGHIAIHSEVLWSWRYPQNNSELQQTRKYKSREAPPCNTKVKYRSFLFFILRFLLFGLEFQIFHIDQHKIIDLVVHGVRILGGGCFLLGCRLGLGGWDRPDWFGFRIRGTVNKFSKLGGGFGIFGFLGCLIGQGKLGWFGLRFNLGRLSVLSRFFV